MASGHHFGSHFGAISAAGGAKGCQCGAKWLQNGHPFEETFDLNSGHSRSNNRKHSALTTQQAHTVTTVAYLVELEAPTMYQLER